MKELDQLKQKMEGLYKLQGFKDLLSRKDLFSIKDQQFLSKKPDGLNLKQFITQPEA